jgi:hypothetical protein
MADLSFAMKHYAGKNKDRQDKLFFHSSSPRRQKYNSRLKKAGNNIWYHYRPIAKKNFRGLSNC